MIADDFFFTPPSLSPRPHGHGVQGNLSGDFVKGVTAKLVTKTTEPVDWEPSWAEEMDRALVDNLFDPNKQKLRFEFELQKLMRSGPRHASFGLPNEDDVERALLGKGEGEMGLGQLIEELEFQLKGKHGVRERVAEIVARKARLVDGKVVWIRT